jgi:hypothetical protein
MPNDLLVLPTFHGWNKQYRHREIKDIDDLLCKLSRASFLQGYFFFFASLCERILGHLCNQGSSSSLPGRRFLEDV